MSRNFVIAAMVDDVQLHGNLNCISLISQTSHVRNSYSSEELSDVLTTSGITEDDFQISEDNQFPIFNVFDNLTAGDHLLSLVSS